MSLDERILDVSKRFARELVQARAKIVEEKERLSKELTAERERLTEELRQRHHLVQAERDVLGHARERIQAISAQLDDDVLALNVGGQLFSTQRSTLCVYEGSYLANLFSGRWESSIERDGDGRYFLDFDPASFRLVLNFLRSKRLEHESASAPPPVVPPERQEHFQNLVEYLGLTEELHQAAEKAKSSRPAAPAAPAPPLGASLLQSASALLGALRGNAEAAAAGAADVEADRQANHEAAGAPAAPAPMRTSGLGLGARGPEASWPRIPAVPPAARDLPGTSTATSSRASLSPPPPQAPSSSSSSLAARPSPAPAVVKRPGWSRKAAHKLALVDELNPCIVSISDTRALGEAAAVRATRGFQSGKHSWVVEVEACSDYSYAGLVAEPWSAVSAPVGRSSHSWGLASSGAAFACREEVGWLKPFAAGSRLVFSVDVDGSGSVSITVDGEEFRDVFKELPAPIFPAVSNCRSGARYRLSFDCEGGGGAQGSGSSHGAQAQAVA